MLKQLILKVVYGSFRKKFRKKGAPMALYCSKKS